MPFVTLCTPTFNRRPFLAASMDCIRSQTYPHHRMEWLVVDDGTDPIGDLLPPGTGTGNDGTDNDENAGNPDAARTCMPAVRYVYSGPDKMPLGAKRNYMNALARGDILVYWDDDDYYPPTRVAHAVDMLLRHPEYRIAGTKSIHVHYAQTGTICQYGPYASSPELASAATFAFRRAYNGRFDGGAALAEESSFTRGFTEPMLALDPKQTILVFEHDQNSYDKKWALRAQSYNGVFGATELTVDDFVRRADDADWAMVLSRDCRPSPSAPATATATAASCPFPASTFFSVLCSQQRAFYVDELPILLTNYAHGSVANKPDVMDTLRQLNQVPPELVEESLESSSAAAASNNNNKDDAAVKPPQQPEEETCGDKKATTVVQPVEYTNVNLFTEDGQVVRMLTAHEIVAHIKLTESKLEFTEKERLAVARERDTMASQAEHWKQECAKLRQQLLSSTTSAEDSDGKKQQNPRKRPRKFGLEDYEQCIAELVCERRGVIEG